MSNFNVNKKREILRKKQKTFKTEVGVMLDELTLCIAVRSSVSIQVNLNVVVA